MPPLWPHESHTWRRVFQVSQNRPFLQSECLSEKRSPKPKKRRQHVRLAKDSEELGRSDSEDGFHAPIFTLEDTAFKDICPCGYVSSPD